MSVASAAWGAFVDCLTCRAAAGRLIEKLSTACTGRAASRCGSIVKKTLSTRAHRCPDCGLLLNRDVSAAIFVLPRGFLWSQTGQHALPCGVGQCALPKAVCVSWRLYALVRFHTHLAG